MTVEEMLDRISSAELSEWMDYNEINPFTPDRNDYMIAQLLSQNANLHRGKSQKLFNPLDFMPWTEKPKESKASLFNKIKGAFSR